MTTRRTSDGAVSATGAITGLLLVGGIAGLSILLGLPSQIAAMGESGLDRLRPAAEATYGEPVRLAGRSDSPPVEVSATAPQRVAARTAAQRPTRGNVLVSARVSIHNIGQVMWSSAQGLSVRATDSEGVSYVRRQVSSTPGPRALPAALTVRPGATTTGVVVFEVPASVDVTRVTVTVGDRTPRSGEWSAHP